MHTTESYQYFIFPENVRPLPSYSYSTASSADLSLDSDPYRCQSPHLPKPAGTTSKHKHYGREGWQQNLGLGRRSPATPSSNPVCPGAQANTSDSIAFPLWLPYSGGLVVYARPLSDGGDYEMAKTRVRVGLRLRLGCPRDRARIHTLYTFDLRRELHVGDDAGQFSGVHRCLQTRDGTRLRGRDPRRVCWSVYGRPNLLRGATICRHE